MLPYYHSTILLYYYTTILPNYYTTTPPYYDTTTLTYCCSIYVKMFGSSVSVLATGIYTSRCMKLINVEWYGCGCEWVNRMGGKGAKEEAKSPMKLASSSTNLIGKKRGKGGG